MEADALVDRQVTIVVKRGMKGIRTELHGQLTAAGGVGVLLASGKSLGFFPWQTIESILWREQGANVSRETDPADALAGK